MLSGIANRCGELPNGSTDEFIEHAKGSGCGSEKGTLAEL
jgi:hypothetical protein